MKQLLITLVAVVLGSTVMNSYAEKRITVFEPNKGNPTVTEESNSDVNEDGKKINARPVIWCDQTLKS